MNDFCQWPEDLFLRPDLKSVHATHWVNGNKEIEGKYAFYPSPAHTARELSVIFKDFGSVPSLTSMSWSWRPLNESNDVCEVFAQLFTKEEGPIKTIFHITVWAWTEKGCTSRSICIDSLPVPAHMQEAAIRLALLTWRKHFDELSQELTRRMEAAKTFPKRGRKATK